MKAVRWHAAGDLRFEEVSEPGPPSPGEAIVEVAWCGICGTDVHEYANGPVMIRQVPHPLTGESPPITLGHEFSGTVFAAGEGVTEAAVGDRVVVDPCWRCGTCFWCRRGEYNICRRGGSIGLASDGALAQLVRVQGAGLVRIPDGVDDRLAALAEPLAVGLHAIRRSRLQVGDTALIYGAGPIGCAVILAARAAGAASIHVVEPRLARRELALTLGATDVYDPQSDDVRRDVYRATGRVGPDAVFECSGVSSLLPEAINNARRGGVVILVGIDHGGVELRPTSLTLYERELIGSLGYQHDLPLALDLINAGQIDPSPMITGMTLLADSIDKAFDALLDPHAEHVKILVDVGAGRSSEGFS